MEATLTEQMPAGMSPQQAAINRLTAFDRAVQQIVERLKEPLDPRIVQWVVAATSGGRDGRRRGFLAAYADPPVHGTAE
jgi:hypothetical protein